LSAAVASVLASWLYENLPLFSLVLHSFLHCHVGDNLWYMHYGFSARLGKAQCWQRPFLHYSLLGMLPKVFEELEAKMKSSDMIK